MQRYNDFEIKKNKSLIFAKKLRMGNFTSQLILWYKQHNRALPWRETKNPYHIWVSEIILQQTRVIQGLSYYHNFIKTFPGVKELANASEDKVLKLWEGLGYYSRARNMHATAKYIESKFNGKFPETYKELLKLKGIGPYTAAAISSICYNEHQTVVDGNVFRVLSRFYGIETPINTTEGAKKFAELAHGLNNGDDYGLFNQALMEFGAIQCTPKKTLCEDCVFKRECYALANNKVEALPVKLKKLKVKKRYLYFLFVRDIHNNTIIQKREGAGIWRGLYQFPLIEGEGKLTIDQLIKHELWQELMKNSEVTIKKEKSLVHKLTHQTLDIHIYDLQVDVLNEIELFEKVSMDAIADYAFPKPLFEWLNTL